LPGILFIISAPSGSGKSTLVNELLRLVPGLEFSVSYTTRPPRGSERPGIEYHFIDRAAFEKMIARNEFLEHANVFGNYYGTAKHVFEDAASRGNDLVLDIDVQGATQIKAKHPNAVSVFILPPSRQVLEKRLRNRSVTEGAAIDAVVERRLNEARKEIENSPFYDYSLVNDQLDLSINLLKAIVLGERALRSGRPLSSEEQKLVDVASRFRQQGRPNAKLQEILETFGQAVKG
jgi:guanylate kinase